MNMKSALTLTVLAIAIWPRIALPNNVPAGHFRLWQLPSQTGSGDYKKVMMSYVILTPRCW